MGFCRLKRYLPTASSSEHLLDNEDGVDETVGRHFEASQLVEGGENGGSQDATRAESTSVWQIGPEVGTVFLELAK